MYERFLKDAKFHYPDFPDELNVDLGLAIKHIRLRMGIPQEELARNAKMKLTALRSLENGYASFTSKSNLEAIAKVLGITASEIILESKEWFPGNFFVLKTDEPVPENKKRANEEEKWFKKKSLSYKGFSIDFPSPPLIAPSHFSFASIEIDPGKEIPDLKLPYPNQVAGFVQRGSLGIIYDARPEMFSIYGNQCFRLRGDKKHKFTNLDSDNSLKFYLAFPLTASPSIKDNPKHKSGSPGLSIGRAINQIRYLYSDWNDKPLTYRELSYLTGLHEKSLQYLESTTEPEQVIYWNKIEQITRSLKMPLARFLELAEGKDEGYLQVATAHDRALIDYRHYLGVRMKSALLPGTDNVFQISETYIEPKGGIRRTTWKRNDNAMIAVSIEDGELLIEVGKNRKTFLKEGESVYFDGSLGYIFTNPGTKPAKAIIATYPPIIF